MTSVVTIATIPITDAPEKLMLSPAVSSNDLTGKDDVFVRINPYRDTAAASANHLISTIGIQKAALICDISSRPIRIRYAWATKREIYE